jgi:hypothetical protein
LDDIISEAQDLSDVVKADGVEQLIAETNRLKEEWECPS